MSTSYDLSSILSKFGSPLVRNNSRSSISKIAPDEFSEMNPNDFFFDSALGNERYDDEPEYSLLFDQDSADVVRSSQRRQLNMTSLMRRLGHALATLTLISLVIGISVFTYFAIQGDKVREDSVVYVSAGAFTLLTVLISFREIYMHLTNFYMPDIQKYVVRILFMIPVYAIQSYLSLLIFQDRIFFDTIRDLYEAFVIASFVYLMIELMGGENAMAEVLATKDEHYGEHPFFFNWFMEPWKMGEQYLFECKYGALQYVVFKVLAAVLIAILEPLGLYGEGSFNPKYGYVYISLVIDVSQTYALYALVKILHATHEDLASPVNWNPIGKAACVKVRNQLTTRIQIIYWLFLSFTCPTKLSRTILFWCLKLVVFFTWWQGVIISFLEAEGIIHDIGNWDADHVAVSFQDYLIIIEMFFFAIAHSFTYPYQEFLRPDNKEFGDDVGYDFDGDAYVSSSAVGAPMRISKALWKSSVPKETFHDINRLKNGISKVMSQPIGIIMDVQDAESI